MRKLSKSFNRTRNKFQSYVMRKFKNSNQIEEEAHRDSIDLDSASNDELINSTCHLEKDDSWIQSNERNDLGNFRFTDDNACLHDSLTKLQEISIKKENHSYPDNFPSLVEYFERKSNSAANVEISTNKIGSLGLKRSHLTRTRSLSLTSFSTGEGIKEEARFQGDHVDHESYHASAKSFENPQNSRAFCERSDENVSNLLVQLMDYCKPKLMAATTFEIYTVDKIIYDVKSSSKITTGESKPDYFMPDFERPESAAIPKRNRSTSDCNRLTQSTTSVNLAKAFKIDEFEEKSPEALNLSMRKPSHPHGNVIEFQTLFPVKNSMSSSSTVSCYSESRPFSRHQNFNVRQTSQLGMDSDASFPMSTRDDRSNNSETPCSRDLNVADRNNNTDQPVSVSSSEDSLLTSYRSRYIASPHPPESFHSSLAKKDTNYMFRYQNPETPNFLDERPKLNKKLNTRNKRASFDLANGIQTSSPFMVRNPTPNRNSEEFRELTGIVKAATASVDSLYSDLQTLWINISDRDTIPPFPASTKIGESRLNRLIELCRYVVQEMEIDWRNLLSNPRMDELDTENQHLRMRLDEAKSIQLSYEFEISQFKKIVKEKEMIEIEVKELSIQIATLKNQQNKEGTIVHAKSSPSNVSMGFNLTLDPNSRERREKEFNSLMEFVQLRGHDMAFYQDQLVKYDQEVDALQTQIEITKGKQCELEKAYATLIDENKAISRERAHIESILKLILQQKQSNGAQSLQELLEKLISKLSSMTASDRSDGTPNEVLEGAIQVVQEQNSNYRDEIQHLKETLSKVSPKCLSGKCVADAEQDSIKRLSQEVQASAEEMQEFRRYHDEKYSQLQEIHQLVSKSKARLEKVHSEKNIELKRTKEELQALQKAVTKENKRIQELQKQNSHLTRELQDFYRNMESLNSVIHQLRTTLQEKTSHWKDRLRVSEDETTESKERCKWLQSQIDQLTQQLINSMERIKSYEKDKCYLAQQLMSAEDERKFVDRRLEDLKVALQGDSVMRQALTEQNDALKVEVNRLRRKLLTRGGEGEFEIPPAEMGTVEALSAYNVVPPSTTEEKHGGKKNCYTTSVPLGYNEESQRITFSMHCAPPPRSQ